MIVFAVASPWAWRHIAEVNKLPVDDVGWREAEIIAHGGRNVQTSSVVNIWLGTLISEDVLKMIGEKRAAIFPFCITRTITLANGYPAVPAHRLSWPRVGLIKPGNHQRRFWLELAVRHIVIRYSTVKRILARNECDRKIAAPR